MTFAAHSEGKSFISSRGLHIKCSHSLNSLTSHAVDFI